MPFRQSKTESSLNLRINLPTELLEKSKLGSGYDPQTDEWELVIKYHDNLPAVLNSLNIDYEELSPSYLIVYVTKQQLDTLLLLNEIESVEETKTSQLMVNNAQRMSCIDSVRETPPDYLSGEGVIVAIIDSGIDYTNLDFRNPDGSTRILYIWDQTVEGNPPENFRLGTEYTQEEINEALNNPNPRSLVPHEDFVYHGTHVAGIAAGNGRASNGEYTGVAPQSSLIIVKLSESNNQFLAKTTNIMRAAKYVIDKASQLNMPIAVNISYGNNYGGHNGSSLFESYLNELSQMWKVSICVPTGNEGASGHHFAAKIAQQEVINAEFTVSSGLTSLFFFLSKSFVDDINIEIIAPSGDSTGIINNYSGQLTYNLLDSRLIIYIGQPTPYNIDQEIVFEIIPNQGYLSEGIWQIKLYGERIVEGNINIWLPITELVSTKTAFLNPSLDTTLTIPSTASFVISVAGYDSNLNAIADFSGKGFDINGIPTPDIAAPAVGIYSSIPNNGYDSFSGTSMAAPFVTGSAALLMQWGIIQGNDPFLYGQRMKAFFRLGAIRFPGATYPNMSLGYGRLCLYQTLGYLKRYNVSTNEELSDLFEEFAFSQEFNPPQFIQNPRIEDAIYSEDFIDLVIEYTSDIQTLLENNPNVLICNILQEKYAIININKEYYESNFEDLNRLFITIEPFALGLMASNPALNASGITQVKNFPFLSLRGLGVLIAVIDTGINYSSDVFKYEDGTSKIYRIWDQTIRNSPPDGFCYGTEYTMEQINEALLSDTPLDIVPTTDESGHGTALASISAGRDTSDFIGAAPDSELVVVKLKPAKENFKERKLISNGSVVFESGDLMNAVEYVYKTAREANRPIAILIGLGTNEGGHDGFSFLEQYLQIISSYEGVTTCCAIGNEGNEQHHAMFNLTPAEPFKNFQIRIAQNEKTMPLYIWSLAQDNILINVTSPIGKIIEIMNPPDKRYVEYSSDLTNTTIAVETIDNLYQENIRLTIINFVNPVSGIWVFEVTTDSLVSGTVHAWLPINNFILSNTVFLSPDPFYTATVPATLDTIIGVGGYNVLDNSLYVSSSRGPSRNNNYRPTLTAPATNVLISGVSSTTTITGTSAAAAITAGACALLLEWGIVKGNDPSMNTQTNLNYLINGTDTRENKPYPNNESGYGRLNLFNAFQNIDSTF